MPTGKFVTLWLAAMTTIWAGFMACGCYGVAAIVMAVGSYLLVIRLWIACW